MTSKRIFLFLKERLEDVAATTSFIGNVEMGENIFMRYLSSGYFFTVALLFFFHCLYAIFVLKCKAVNTSLVDLITDLYLVLRNSTLFRLFKTDRQNNV